MEDNGMSQHANITTALEEGAVLTCEGNIILVQAESGVYTAKRSASCLLNPAPGDKALLYTGGEKGAFVLSVLERSTGVPNSIRIEGDTDLCVIDGELTISARDGVDIGSPEKISISSDRFDLGAREGSVMIDNMSFVGSLLSAHVGMVKLVAKTFDSVLDRLSQRLKRYYRTVEEIESLKADMIHYTAERALVANGENTIITAKKNIKINGDLIQIG